MFTLEILWNDLTPKKQEEIIEEAKKHFKDAEDIFPGNYDVFPLAFLEIDDDID